MTREVFDFLFYVLVCLVVSVTSYRVGFIEGVEEEKEDTIRRSVNFGDCKLVFHE